MFKKIIVSIIVLLVLAGIGIFYYLYTQKKIESSASDIKPATTPSINIPKVTTYQVPILMYHYIRDASNESQLGKNLSVSPETFKMQVKWLKENNYSTIKLADMADPDKKAISKIYFEKKKPIILTFDDGYLDAYTQAFPVLKEYQFSGTFFVINDYIGRDYRLTQAQIAEMEQVGMEFGSHTLSHPDLTKINIDEAKNQIFNSKGNYQTFCYPAGKYNDAIVGLIKEAGYVAAVTTKFGVADENSNLLELKRVRIENFSAEEMKNKIDAVYEQSH